MRDLAAGFGYLVKGQRWVSRNTRWWVSGLLPALITLVLYVAVLVLLGFWADDIAVWMTPFANDWDAPWPGLLRGVVTALVFLGGLLFAVVSFAAVTLLVGQFFYDALAEQVDETEGGAPPAPEVSLWRELWIAAWDSVLVLGRVALYGAVLFLLGFLPFVGQTVIPVIGFCVSGYFLTAELTAVALQRRGVDLAGRLALLRGRRMLSIGFGVPLALLFLVPLAAVFLMPGAVAGATLLARDLLPPEECEPDQDAEELPARPSAPAPPGPVFTKEG
ncbi:EI24 domain-containing protein [Streptomyces sp. TP-A0874]|uniref:EI24 domain-containing protein n=1 Tax=Streptomyces sp. TP-A0874 TaxID=549819 RepID=UPI00099FAB8C|nr:EI24 domain-containing protein [Streptomyces sp. TP-A0874]